MIIKAKQLSKIYGSNNNKVIALNNVWKWKKHTFTYFKWIR